jgi:hypothetical protein
MTATELLFEKYRGKRILLDANLLLLFLIGTFDRGLIDRFKRTASFAAGDFGILANIIPMFRHFITTPQILTEVSSLANALPDFIKPEWNKHLRSHTANLFEILKSSVDLMETPAFVPFGLADASVFAAAFDTLILTEGFRLSGFLRAANLPVLNFRDLLALASESSS